MKGTFDRETHRYFIDGIRVPSNTEVLKFVGIVDDSFYTEEGKERGKAVHLACQLLDEGSLNWKSLHPKIEPYLRSYEAFKADTGFAPTMIEVPHYNFTYFYGTTPDRIGTLPGRGEILLEFKSGPVEPWAGIQLALQNECLPKRLPRFGLQLRADGKPAKLKEFTDPIERNIGLNACSVVHWVRNHGGKIYGIEPSKAA